MVLRVLTEEFSICRLDDCRQVPLDRPFVFIAVTDEERSLVCPTGLVPPDVAARSDGWRAFRVAGVLDFSLVGILSGISAILAGNGIGIFAVSTYNTDYVMTRTADFDRALQLLSDSGYEIKY